MGTGRGGRDDTRTRAQRVVYMARAAKRRVKMSSRHEARSCIVGLRDEGGRGYWGGGEV